MSTHRGKFNLDKLHSKEACLSKCEGCGTFRSGACSYRQAGYDQAKAHPTVYNYPAYRSLCGTGDYKTGAYATAASTPGAEVWYPPGHNPREPRPKPGDWDIKGDNFTHWLKPYWHNHHHIIPASTFNTSIDNTGDTPEYGPLIPEMIRGGLLKQKYSIHHQRNLVILPQGLQVAKALQLPRHLRGDELPSAKHKFNHPDYNLDVEKQLNTIMSEYKKEIAESLKGKKHPKLPDKLSTAKLKYLSIKLYDRIISEGKYLSGRSLDEMVNPAYNPIRTS